MDEETFLAAIRAMPNDQRTRLVYADWLDEHDRAEEAEFVRVGCRLAAISPDDQDYPELLLRRDELAIWLATHVPGPTPKFPAGLELPGRKAWWHNSHRGFPRYFEFDGETRPGLKPMRELAAALGKGFAAVPTRMLAIRFITAEQLAELLRQPVVEHLDAITIQLRVGNDPHDDAARLVADCPRLRNLREAVLAFDVTETGAAALAASPHLGNLDRLLLEPQDLTPAAVRSLGGAGWFRNLRSLGLTDRLQDGAFEELCRLDPFPRLHTLDLSNNAFSARAWAAFARSEAFPALARLDLALSDLSEGRLAALASGSGWLHPAYLDLTGCAMGNDGAAALAAAPWLGSVRWLSLRANRLTADGLTRVVRGEKLAGLRYLDLGSNTPGVKTLRALAGNPALRGLLSLNLARCGEKLTRDHVHDFLTRLDLPALRDLNLAECPLGAKAAVLGDDKSRTLTRLDLGECGLTDAAAAKLIAAPALQNLLELGLTNNRLGTGLTPLTDRRNLPRLAMCHAQGNRPGADLQAKLRRRPGVEV